MKQARILCLGELMLDMVAQSGENGEVTGFSMKPGGAAGNVAVAVSRLGGKSGIIAKVSKDFFGEHMKAVMEENGVDASGVILDPQRKIALAFVTFDAERKPTYLFYRENAASASLSAEEIDPAVFQGAQALYFSSMGLVRDPLRAANYEAARQAAAAGARVAFDPNVRLGVWPSPQAAREEILRMLSLVNICKMNDEELAFLFGEGDMEAKCREIFASCPRMELLAITLGADGALLMNSAGRVARVGTLSTDVVDTVGAGDSFFATLLMYAADKDFALEDEQVLTEALTYANAAALLTAQRPGAIPAMPALAEVERMRAGYAKKSKA